MTPDITIILPAQEFWVTITAFGIAALSGLVFWATAPTRNDPNSDEAWTLRALNIFGLILAPFWFALICATFVGLWNTLLHSSVAQDATGARWNALAIIGHTTALLALVSAPLALIRVYTTERQTRTAEQGHMTDRISKAVEHLGAEKTVKIPGKDAKGGDITNEASVANIEVRCGGLLSLERIAQDSVKYDNGRDHVRVMEVLCLYIRENARAAKAKDHEYGDWEPLKDDPTEAERAEHLEKREDRFGAFFYEAKVWLWAQTLPPPREDIAIALRIIGRRSAKQRIVEAAWPAAPDAKTVWFFDTPCPALPDKRNDAPLSTAALQAYLDKLRAWKVASHAYSGYRPDLRHTNLQKTDLSELILSGAKLTGARMEGAYLREARIEGADFSDAWMEGANLIDARMEGADLRDARMEGANLIAARMEGANLYAARMEGANLYEARMEGATLRSARMEGANLYEARMEGANLIAARMEGADLDSARMEGAYLYFARMDSGTSLDAATLRGAALKSTDYSSVAISPEQIKSCFGDASVKLPGDVTPDSPDWPPHWPKETLDLLEYIVQWHKWRAGL